MSRLARFLAAVMVIAGGILSFPARSAAAPGATSISVGGPLEVLANDPTPFRVPILLQHPGDSSLVQIGLDYDELMLRFNESWSVRDALARMPLEVLHIEEDGYLRLTIPFDPAAGGRNSEALLIELEFHLRSTVEEAVYSPRVSTALDIDDKNTYLVRTADRARVRPDAALDGAVTIFHRDAIELGSARMTPERMEFRLPLHVTHLRPESAIFSIGLDYDELFLQLLRVEPVSPLIRGPQVRFDEKNGPGQKAWVEAPFVDGIYPQLLRHHLLDLVFEYRSESGSPVEDLLRVTPLPTSGPNAGGEGGSAEVDVHEGTIYLIPPSFLRGDANASGKLDLNDAMVILGSRFLGALALAESPTCLDAMDADASGAIDVTDAVLVLDYLFLGGRPPAEPFPEAGPAPTGMPRLGCPDGSARFEPIPLR